MVVVSRGKDEKLAKRIDNLIARSHYMPFKRNISYFDLHYDDFKEKYSDEYVAVHEGRVVDHEKDYFKLIEKLRKEWGDLEAFVIDFVSSSEPELLL